MSGSYGESVRLRIQADANDDEVSRDVQTGSTGSPCVAAKTINDGTYPTVISACYACELLAVLGSEVAGASATHEASGTIVKAFNLGTAVPPVGTSVVLSHVAYRWVFRYP